MDLDNVLWVQGVPEREYLERWAQEDLRSVNGQIEYLLRCALQDAGRLPGADRAQQEAA